MLLLSNSLLLLIRYYVHTIAKSTFLSKIQFRCNLFNIEYEYFTGFDTTNGLLKNQTENEETFT